MCLICKRQEPKVATEDITCYKKVKILDKSYFLYADYAPNYHSSDLQYIKGALNQTEMKESSDLSSHDQIVTDHYFGGDFSFDGRGNNMKEQNLMSIGEGFHSASYQNRIILYFSWEGTVRCTIPKGSLYHKDETGLMVSNQIILHEIVDRLERE